MDTSKPSDAKLKSTGCSGPAAFSLVEVTLALGIAAFALISIFGLLPTGLNTFHQAIDATVGSQIVQRIVNEAQQSDFDQLITDASGNTIIAGAGRKHVRYFDDQGTELDTRNAERSIYKVNTRIMPATAMPGNVSYVTLATVTVQIANNPGNLAIVVEPSTQLWRDKRLPISTYSCMVARNR